MSAKADFEKFLAKHHPNARRNPGTLSVYSMTGDGFAAALRRAFNAGRRSAKRAPK